jgi:hypothetical protein
MGGANHDFAFEWQLFRERIAQAGFTHIFPNNKRADGANVDDAEVRQLLRDERRLASIRTTDVHRAKKHDARHLANLSRFNG